MSLELAITIVVALIGLLNALLATSIWFRLGGLTTGQIWIEKRLKSLEGRIGHLETKVKG